jgi:hypothetical protein
MAFASATDRMVKSGGDHRFLPTARPPSYCVLQGSAYRAGAPIGWGIDTLVSSAASSVEKTEHDLVGEHLV